jgi:hypothetical protein
MSLNTCNDNDHDEICHEGRDCPACAIIEKKNEEIEELESKVESLKDELNSHVCETEEEHSPVWR